MWAFILALWSMASRAISRSTLPSRCAAIMNNGRMSTLTMVSRHSRANMTASRAIVSIRLVTMLTMVLLMAFCAPTTSLLRRLISSPTLVLVKNRSDIRCRRAKREERRS